MNYNLQENNEGWDIVRSFDNLFLNVEKMSGISELANNVVYELMPAQQCDGKIIGDTNPETLEFTPLTLVNGRAAKTACDADIRCAALYDHACEPYRFIANIQIELQREQILESIVYREVPVQDPGWSAKAFRYWSDGEVMVGSFPGKGGQRGLFVMHARGMEQDLFDQAGLFDRFPSLKGLGHGVLDALKAAPAGAMGSKHCSRWREGQAVLIGDAAHAIVPFMGQGLNTGLEDAVALMRQYRSRNGADHEAVLERFVRRRQQPAEAIRNLSDRHARHLLGQSTVTEQALEERSGAVLRSTGLPDTLSA